MHSARFYYNPTAVLSHCLFLNACRASTPLSFPCVWHYGVSYVCFWLGYIYSYLFVFIYKTLGLWDPLLILSLLFILHPLGVSEKDITKVFKFVISESVTKSGRHNSPNSPFTPKNMAATNQIMWRTCVWLTQLTQFAHPSPWKKCWC